MYIIDERYELASDFTGDLLISELDNDLLETSILGQILSPLSTRTNFLSVAEEKFNFITETDNVDLESDEIQEELESIRSIMTFTILKIDETFGLDIDIQNMTSDRLIVDTAVSLYNFLILRYKKNICKFLYMYIKKNRKALVEEFNLNIKSKDVSTISLKKKIKNKDLILLISNLTTIIKHILTLDIDNSIFIDYTCDDDYYEGLEVGYMISNSVITGEFVNRYMELMTTEYNDILDEIENEVRSRIIKK